MSNQEKFTNRVYGISIIKSINSNYNADFTNQPRTLPNGIVYATDKVLKYSIRNYLKKTYPNDIIFYFKKLNEDLNPVDLIGMYESYFDKKESDDKKKDKKNELLKASSKKDILKNLLKCLDIRLFGATFAPKGNDGKNLSLHGPVQINHGVNRFPENNIYSEQIMAPFSNIKEAKSGEESSNPNMTTLGSQSKLAEGHYVHHFSINPINLEESYKVLENDSNFLSTDDIEKLKEGLRKGVSYYDSASKSGTENELLLWIELKKESKLIVPNLTELVEVKRVKDKVQIDLTKIEFVLKPIQDQIEKIVLYSNPNFSEVSFQFENSQVELI